MTNKHKFRQLDRSSQFVLPLLVPLLVSQSAHRRWKWRNHGEDVRRKRVEVTGIYHPHLRAVILQRCQLNITRTHSCIYLYIHSLFISLSLSCVICLFSICKHTHVYLSIQTIYSLLLLSYMRGYTSVSSGKPLHSSILDPEDAIQEQGHP